MVLVKVDDREPDVVFEIMKELEITTVRCRMDEGDYVWNDVVVERKTIDDFCGSIIDGRLKNQVEKMRQKFPFIYVVVVGNIGDRTSEIHENCILGMLASLAVKGVQFLMVDNERQFCYLVKRIFERYEEVRNEKKDNK